MQQEDPVHGIAMIAKQRGDGWRLLAQVTQAPDAELVQLLRSGSWQAQFRAAVQWLNVDTFERALPALDTLVRRAARRSAEEDLTTLEVAWVPPVSDIASHADALEALAELCDAESRAWATGDLENAKRLRREETEAIENSLIPVLPDWCVAIDTAATPITYRVIGRLVASYLSVESGRDFDSSLFPHPVEVVGSWASSGADGESASD